MMVSVNDESINNAQKFLAKNGGIYVEKSAAATLAGLIKVRNKAQKLKVVLILTGSGLKESIDKSS